ncbi:MAG TPA: MarR family transcriptional regulator [Chloroflexia bacterium]|nr:MarR family transcriptional regulator [Chloroflexia bacterium]
MARNGELRYLILAAQREGSRLFADQVRPLGLTPSQAEVLRVLHEAQPLSLIALGERLVCETGSPSRLVDGLVQAGLVTRRPSATDQRKVTLSLTPAGAARYQQLAAVEQRFDALITQFTSGGDPATLAVITAALWQFVQDKPSGRALARRFPNNGPDIGNSEDDTRGR